MTPLIYNLFPRLVGPVTRWPEHAAAAAEMGFNWLYLNPWHYPDGDLRPLASALDEIAALGLRPMMDLVVNHTSKDALLTREHPEWFVRDADGGLVSPSVVDPWALDQHEKLRDVAPSIAFPESHDTARLEPAEVLYVLPA